MIDNIVASTILMTVVCDNCSGNERRILHNVSHLGSLRRLCTTCVLRLYPQSFCPTCFTVYHQCPSSPPSVAGVTCTICYSVSHASCVGTTRQRPYICPMCCSTSNNAPIFVLKNVKELISKGSGRGADNLFTCLNDEKGMDIDMNDENGGLIDVKAARILVAAATISSLSMSKEELAAKYEAERRAKEAVDAAKRAKHALEYMAALVSIEPMKRNEGSRIEVPMARFGGNVGGIMERRDRYSHDDSVENGRGGSLEMNRTGNLERIERNLNGILVRDIMGIELRENEVLGGVREIYSHDSVENRGGDSLERNRISSNLERLERNSNGVLVRDITRVGLRGNGVLGGIAPHSSVVIEPYFNRDATMGVDDQKGISCPSSLDVENLGEGNLKKLKMSSKGVLVRDITEVEWRDNGGLGGVKPHSSVVVGSSFGNGASMNVHDQKGMSLDSCLNFGNSGEGQLEKSKRSSNKMLVRDITGVELRERGGLGGIFPHSSVLVGPYSSNGDSIDVHDQWGTSLCSSLDVWNSFKYNLEKLERSSNNGVLVREMTGVELRKKRILEGIGPHSSVVIGSCPSNGGTMVVMSKEV